ncbi:MAG: type II secretion system protein GspC [Gammaproteobacteria bacterium]|nr:type II secretion system protein GspC [Gammaproteobacteria bacterium]MDH5800573.1 type II secretion system protein GspC [Gammaproteobacteria bacterium]
MKYWEFFLQHYWVDRLDKRMPAMVTILLVIMLGNTLAQITWKLVPVPEHRSTFSQDNRGHVSPVSRTNAQEPVALQISAWNLFGKFEQQVVVEDSPPPPVEDAPETRLNLKLKGVFATKDPYSGLAIIADSKGDDAYFSTGETVTAGAVLAQVFEDKVLLERNGSYETLKLPVELPPSTGADEMRRDASLRRSSAPSRDLQMNPAAQTTLKKYRDDLVNNPQTVMSKFPLRVQPYNKGGKLVGYRVRPGKDRKLLGMLGLRNGDVVTSVNGIPLDNPLKALEIIKALPSTTQFTVDFERNGVPQSSSFTLP